MFLPSLTSPATIVHFRHALRSVLKLFLYALRLGTFLRPRWFQLRLNVTSGRMCAAVTVDIHQRACAAACASLYQSHSSTRRATFRCLSLSILGSWNAVGFWSPMPTVGRALAAAGASRTQRSS